MRIFGISDGSMYVHAEGKPPVYFDTKESVAEYMRTLKREDFDTIMTSSSMDFPEDDDWLHDDDPMEWLRDGIGEGMRAL
jgi:hypothetical protein